MFGAREITHPSEIYKTEISDMVVDMNILVHMLCLQ